LIYFFYYLDGAWLDILVQPFYRVIACDGKQVLQSQLVQPVYQILSYCIFLAHVLISIVGFTLAASFVGAPGVRSKTRSEQAESEDSLLSFGGSWHLGGRDNGRSSRNLALPASLLDDELGNEARPTGLVRSTEPC